MAATSSPPDTSPKSKPIEPTGPQSEDSIAPLLPSQQLSTPKEQRSNVQAINIRRPSIQFAPSVQIAANNPPKPQPPKKSQRRMSSPPPPPSFQKRVSFNTFESKDTPEFSLTLNTKHRDFHYSRRSRIYLCGLNDDEYSQNALEWLIDELVDDGDEIIVLRVVDPNSKYTSDKALREERYAKEARESLDWVISRNHEEKAISLVMEFAVGEVTEIIQRMIHTYEPAILVVGTRGKSLSGIQGLLPGSVSKYCLQNSPVPVIVVQPHNKQKKQKTAREKKPEKGSYQEILQMGDLLGTHIFGAGNPDDPLNGFQAASTREAEAVADAIGVPAAIDYSKPDYAAPRYPGRAAAAAAAAGVAAASEEGEPPKSPGVVMKSPTLGNLDSPVDSDEESDRDEAVPKAGSILSTHDVPSDDESTKKKAEVGKDEKQ